MLFGALARGKPGDVLSVVGNYGELEWRSREWKKRAHHRPLYGYTSELLRFSVIAAAWMQFAEFAEFAGQIAFVVSVSSFHRR